MHSLGAQNQLRNSMCRSVRIVALSDTHGFHRQVLVPAGDILIHAGDLTGRGSLEEVRDFNAYLGELPHQQKVIIAGNHDWCFEHNPVVARSLLTNGIYLQDQAVVIAGLTIYGSPWQPWFYDWAFNLPRGAALRAKWARIPGTTDILVTHGPPYGYGDTTDQGISAGCADLLSRIEHVRPKLHICGHIHEGAGVRTNGHTTLINASVCDEN
jgi:Icc-related predicted phosphoesterase